MPALPPLLSGEISGELSASPFLTMAEYLALLYGERCSDTSRLLFDLLNEDTALVPLRLFLPFFSYEVIPRLRASSTTQ